MFDNGDPEEFFVRNFNMTIAALGKLGMGTTIQYLSTLVHGEVLRHFYSLSSDMEITETLTLEYIIKGLALYAFPVNLISKQKRVMRRRMSKPRSLKVRSYVARFIDFNKYLGLFPGDTFSDKIGVTELEKKMLNSMPNDCSKQVYVQGFDCEYILLKII